MLLWAWSIAHAAESVIADRIAAVVNEEVIALSEVYEIGREFVSQQCPASEAGADEACVKNVEIEILDALIRRALMRQELSRLQLDVTAEDVDQAIDRTVQQYQLPDRQALREEVERSGKRWDQYREELLEFLRTQAFQGRILGPRVTITEDEVRDLYQRTSRQVTTPAVKLSGLGLASAPGASPEEQEEVEAQATALVASLNAGEIGWPEAIERYDAGLASMFADQTFEPGDLVPPIAAVVFVPDAPMEITLPPVRMSSPTGADVWFVLRIDEKTISSDVAPYEEVKPQLEQQVLNDKLGDAEEEWYQRARREAAVDVKIRVN